jgi:hypothetical protein
MSAAAPSPDLSGPSCFRLALPPRPESFSGQVDIGDSQDPFADGDMGAGGSYTVQSAHLAIHDQGIAGGELVAGVVSSRHAVVEPLVVHACPSNATSIDGPTAVSVAKKAHSSAESTKSQIVPEEPDGKWNLVERWNLLTKDWCPSACAGSQSSTRTATLHPFTPDCGAPLRGNGLCPCRVEWVVPGSPVEPRCHLGRYSPSCLTANPQRHPPGYGPDRTPNDSAWDGHEAGNPRESRPE